ncbi:hypothetical protein KDW_28550 [Dictyobacter vulcani]|uniref:Ketosynthase family 3 (KS3) domain-containing protein n=1 Tax=Dictyobacter vulcani TaxID=2607529 RepID=A0A5J4KLM9_9CHLR|nr:hypothetical protein [Dictyobacter vulcani]GER88693.1 hypothetical protein KDW_28550 [Dictyobacter vulcani]
MERGATIYAEITGYGQSNDAHGLLPPSEDGTRYARALCQAIQAGGMSPDDVAYLSLDGRALPSSDQGEVDALRQVFGTRLQQIPASVPRTMFGHSYAAAGALDTITALLSLKHGQILPTLNCDQFNPHYEFNLVRDKPQPLPSSGSQVALVGGRGTGGTNVALTLRKER